MNHDEVKAAVAGILGEHHFAGERGPTSQTGCVDDDWQGVNLTEGDFNQHVAEAIALAVSYLC